MAKARLLGGRRAMHLGDREAEKGGQGEVDMQEVDRKTGRIFVIKVGLNAQIK